MTKIGPYSSKVKMSCLIMTISHFGDFPNKRSSSSIKSLTSLIAEIEARVEETWEMSDTAGVVLQFSQRKL